MSIRPLDISLKEKEVWIKSILTGACGDAHTISYKLKVEKYLKSDYNI